MISTLNRQRITMFVVGGIAGFGVASLSESTTRVEFFVNWGIVALLMYEVMQRTRNALRLATYPLYVLITILVGFPIVVTLFYLESSISLPPDFLSSWLNLQIWLEVFTTPPGNWQLLITAALIVATGYSLLRRPITVTGSIKQYVHESEGYGGVEMEPTKSETTRYLCASAVLLGNSFRTRVLNQLREEHQATAPELGVDMSLVDKVCRFFERRETRYQLLFSRLYSK